MGLSDYVNPDKSKLVNSVIGGEKEKQKSDPAANIPKSSSSLTLQEKRQMMQNQQISKPSPSPTDLTDTLVYKSMSMNVMSMTNSTPLNNSNLSSMNSSQSMNFSSPLAKNTNWSNNSQNLSNNFNNSVTTGFGNFR